MDRAAITKHGVRVYGKATIPIYDIRQADTYVVDSLTQRAKLDAIMSAVGAFKDAPCHVFDDPQTYSKVCEVNFYIFSPDQLEKAMQEAYNQGKNSR